VQLQEHQTYLLLQEMLQEHQTNHPELVQEQEHQTILPELVEERPQMLREQQEQRLQIQTHPQVPRQD
jgi:hypothetical protein